MTPVAASKGRRPVIGKAALMPAYFAGLQSALAKKHLAEPVLVLDKQRLDRNITRLRDRLPRDMAYRIVAKSLPCVPLLQHIAKRAKTDRLMSFNVTMAGQLLAAMPQADQLMGKPVPTTAIAGLFNTLKPAAAKRAAQQIQWLADTPERVRELGALAHRLQVNLRLALEIDVGLHRGGMMAGTALDNALVTIAAHPRLTLSGLMGYEPHLTKLPKIGTWRKRARQGALSLFADAMAQIAAQFGEAAVKDMIRNMAGSPTFKLYGDTDHANELAAGSVLVKPSDFDMPLLKDFEPAGFIATPVLKQSKGVLAPAAEFSGGLLGAPRRGTTLFIHGGNWMAKPVFPRGLEHSPLFGRSSNQDMLTGSVALKIAIDDFVFLRPTQSETVFLQFPKIAIFDGKRISDLWHPLPVSA